MKNTRPPASMMLSLFVGLLWGVSAHSQEADSDAQALEPPVSQLTADAQKLLDAVQQRVTNINTDELKALLEAEPLTQLIDVRTPSEIALYGGSIDAPRHRNLTRGWLDLQIGGIIPDKDTPIVVYCGVNQRSPMAAESLMQRGYTQVKNYQDGFYAWKAAGLPVDVADEAISSFLYSMPVEVIPGVWSAIGATAPPTYENSGHNNNLSFVITDDGVVVVNAGESYLLAKSLHDEIRKHTDQPVKYVVLENGQGHAMLGSNYWQEQGAKVVIHKDAWHEVEERREQMMERIRPRRDKNFRTQVIQPDIIMEEDSLNLTLGSWKIDVVRLGPAHSPGDISVWLPEKKLIITGDLVFHERLLPVFEETDTGGWIETWEAFEGLGAEYFIPGHGHPTTDIGVLTRYTHDYLVFMREKIGAIIDDGGSLDDAYRIDQSAYAHLDTFDELALRNAGMIFRAMEFE